MNIWFSLFQANDNSYSFSVLIFKHVLLKILLLGITDLHNGMILSSLSIALATLLLVFPKGLIPMEMYSLLINL